MQKPIIKRAIAVMLPAVALAIGHYLHDPIKAHNQQFEGVWTGQSVIQFDQHTIDSYATLVVDKDDIRLSINNKSGSSNYAFDAKLELHYTDKQYNRLQLVDREVTGLERFEQETGIRVPVSGTLIELNGWRLEEDEIFFNFNSLGEDSISYVVKRKR